MILLTRQIDRQKSKTQGQTEKDKTSKGNCCFNHIIGLPRKNGKGKPLFDYKGIIATCGITSSTTRNCVSLIPSLVRFGIVLTSRPTKSNSQKITPCCCFRLHSCLCYKQSLIIQTLKRNEGQEGLDVYFKRQTLFVSLLWC